MKRIWIDAGKCDGCLNCTLACMNAHRADKGSIYDLDLTDPANESRNFIRRQPDGSYRPIFCRHCDEPECVNSCMSGALSKNRETGIVEYDEKQCAGCFMCVMNCPFGVLKPDNTARSRIIKCDFCKDSGSEPSCVKACPKKAIWIEEVESGDMLLQEPARPASAQPEPCANWTGTVKSSWYRRMTRSTPAVCFTNTWAVSGTQKESALFRPASLSRTT